MPAARGAHNKGMAKSASLASPSLLDAGIWVTVLKLVTAHTLPEQHDSGNFFHYRTADNNSFPSGHAMAAFSIASVFPSTYHEHKWVPWVSYGLAGLVGVPRVVLARHYPGDVIVGSVPGASIGRGVVARSDDGSPARNHGMFGPVVGPNGEVGGGLER